MNLSAGERPEAGDADGERTAKDVVPGEADHPAKPDGADSECRDGGTRSEVSGGTQSEVSGDE